VSRFLTAQQHNLGHLVPLKVKDEERESRPNHKTMFNDQQEYTNERNIKSVRYNQGTGAMSLPTLTTDSVGLDKCRK